LFGYVYFAHERFTIERAIVILARSNFRTAGFWDVDVDQVVDVYVQRGMFVDGHRKQNVARTQFPMLEQAGMRCPLASGIKERYGESIRTA
tara:strand:+ start:303850 stop:304122 length:273 start_codon:yes stop_codon:yes gene_type:complete